MDTAQILITIPVAAIIILYIYFVIKNKYLGNKSLDSSSNIEGFSSQYSSLSSQNKNYSNTVQFDTNWYMRNNSEPVIINNKVSLPPLKYGLIFKDSYEDKVGQYFRHKIYPVELTNVQTDLDAIYKFINNELDIMFLDEEIISRFIKKDCKYLTQLIIANLGIDMTQKTNDQILNQIYPKLNISAIGIGFHQDFYLIVNNFSNVFEYPDIKNRTIGVFGASLYNFMKFCITYGMPLTDINFIVENDIKVLIDNFMINKYDGIFIVANPKSKILVNLTFNKKVRFIHLQKRPGLESRNNLINLIPEQQGSEFGRPVEAPTTANQLKYASNAFSSETISGDLRSDFNKILKKNIHNVKIRAVDLNKFYPTGNPYTYVDTYSIRTVLVVRNDLPRERVKMITRNYINNLNKMRDDIDRETFITKKNFNNFSSDEFQYNELVSFDTSIPLHPGAKDVYLEEGLIYNESSETCIV